MVSVGVVMERGVDKDRFKEVYSYLDSVWSWSMSLSAHVSSSGSRSLSWHKSFSKSRFRSVSVAHSRFGFKRNSWSRYASLDLPEEAT